MKRITGCLSFFWALVIILLLPACTKKVNELNTNLGAVKTLFAPDNGKYVKLQPASGASLSFEWEAGQAEDGTLVQYEVAFDSASGNFSHPLYSVVSDGNGLKNTLTLTHKDLNKIASMAGIQPLSIGTLRWTVISFKGINTKKTDTSRLLTVERPAGFSDIPAAIYLTGDATEAGTDFSKAIQMKSISPGVFEAFTKLKTGTYFFADRKSGTPVTYSFQGSLMKQGGTNSQTGDKVYRIRLDFNNAAAEVIEITAAGLYQSAYGTVTGALTYTGNGTWFAANVPVVFYQYSWGRDERYKFQLTIKDANGSASSIYYGTANQSTPNRPTSATPASFYYVVPVDNSQWDYTYKFNGDADNHNCDITLDLNPADTYTHIIKIN